VAEAGSLQKQAEATHEGASKSSNATSVACGGGQRHRSRVRQHHRQHRRTETPYCGMYVDYTWLATSFNNREFDVRWMSAQLDQLMNWTSWQTTARTIGTTRLGRSSRTVSSPLASPFCRSAYFDLHDAFGARRVLLPWCHSGQHTVVVV